jgi:hypothetical protein
MITFLECLSIAVIYLILEAIVCDRLDAPRPPRWPNRPGGSSEPLA